MVEHRALRRGPDPQRVRRCRSAQGLLWRAVSVVCAASLAVLALGATAAAGDTGGTFLPRVSRELDTPPGSTDAHALAINASGAVAGYTTAVVRDEAWSHAVVWTPSPTEPGHLVPQVLRELEPGDPLTKADGSVALGINDGGLVVGFSQAAGQQTHAVLWEPAGANRTYSKPVDLGAQYGDQVASVAVAVNNSGVILGCVGNASLACESPAFAERPALVNQVPDSDTTHAVIWRKHDGGYSGSLVDAGDQATSTTQNTTSSPSSGNNSWAAAINAEGDIAGEINNQAVVWKPSVTVETAPQVPGPVGTGPVPTASIHYTPTPLPPAEPDNLGPAIPDPTSTINQRPLPVSWATALNDAGVVVGAVGGNPVVWTQQVPPAPVAATSTALPGASVSSPPTVGPLYAMTPLPVDPAATTTQALAVDDAGTIAGRQDFGSLHLHDGYALTWRPLSPDGRYATPSPAVIEHDGPFGAATAINAAGVMVGEVHPGPQRGDTHEDLRGYHATLWMPPVLPGAPVMGTALANDGQVTVDFATPASDGGNPITSYTATASPGGTTVTGSDTPLTLMGLTDGTPYTVTVRATNAVGTGPPSAPSDAVTPVAPDPSAGDLGRPPDNTFIFWFWGHRWHGSHRALQPLVRVHAAAPRAAAGAPATTAATAALQAALRGVPGRHATRAQLPPQNTGGGGHTPDSGDTFLLVLTALVAGPAALLAAAWAGWHRGFMAAMSQRLGVPRRRRTAAAEASW